MDQEKRTAQFPVSSEYPVEKWYGFEILDHSPAAIDLSRLKSGASLRDTHYGDVIGIVEDASINAGEKRLWVNARYSKSQRAEEIFQDIIDGIRKNVSMRYMINEMVLEREVDGVGYYRVTSWQPIHVSEEPDPADPTVGHGRSNGEDEETVIPLDIPGDEKVIEQIEKFNRTIAKDKGLKILLTNKDRSANKMTDEEIRQKEAAEKAERELQLKNDREAAREAETNRIQSIYGLAADFQRNLPGIDLKVEAEKFVAEGKSDREFTKFIREKMKAPEALRTPDSSLGLSDKEKKAYSLRNIILALADGKVDNLKVELEASRTIADRLGRPQSKSNIFVPYDIQLRQMPELIQKEGKRDVVVGTPSAGGLTVQYQYPAGSFLEILMNAMVAPQLGIDIWENLVGDIPMTRELSSNIFYWVAESNGPTQSDISFGQDTMAPKTGGCLTKFSHKFLIQNSVGGEAYITRKLALATGVGYDSAIINGTGANNQPKGLRNQTGLGGAIGTGFTRDKAIDMVRQIESANALVLGTPKWLTDPTTAATLSLIDTTTGGFGKWLLDQGNMVDLALRKSNQVTQGDLFVGIWNALILGMWGVVEIKANEFGSGFAAGDIEVRSLVDMDVYVAYPGAFAKAASVSK